MRSIKYSSEPNTDDSETIIWRYMDYWKLEHILKTKKLYIPSILSMDDVREGSKTEFEYLKEKKALSLPDEFIISENFTIKNLRSVSKNLALARKMILNGFYISCWSKSLHENELLWNRFCEKNTAVAIKSTNKKLQNSLPNYCDFIDIKYIDRANEISVIEQNTSIASYKGIEYTSENEYRALVDVNKNKIEAMEDHILIDIDINSLIDSIYIGPHCNEIIIEKLKCLIDKYKIDVDLNPSILGLPARY